MTLPPVPIHWPYVLLFAISLAYLIALVTPLYTPVGPMTRSDRRLQGCLQWCQSHGAYETPDQYLDCADRCEEALPHVDHKP